MIYLSLLELSPRSRQVQAELRDPYQMHRTISKAFGDDAEAWRAARCLFRVDETGTSPHPRLLVQSRARPEWDRLTVRTDYLAVPPCVKAWEPAFREGQVLAFRLRANPTVKRNEKRVPLKTEPERLDWLRRKAETGGFAPGRVAVTQDDPLETRTAKGHEATLNAVRFDGILRVTDPKVFTGVIEQGVGSAKAFGFGMMSLARV